MATHDPIINFYDDPGHPYWPSENGGSGSGGGSELGELYDVQYLTYVTTAPIVGEQLSVDATYMSVIELSIGDKVISVLGDRNTYGGTIRRIAAGAIVKVSITGFSSEHQTASVYKAAIASGGVVSSVSKIGDYVIESDDLESTYITITIPDIGNEPYLFFTTS